MSVDADNTKASVVTSAENIFGDKNGNFLYAIHLVEKYNLFSDLNLPEILKKLAEN